LRHGSQETGPGNPGNKSYSSAIWSFEAIASAQVLDKEVVTWINDDDIPHTVASSGKLFKSRALDTKDKFSFAFRRPARMSISALCIHT
jgi:hypothetical protein